MREHPEEIKQALVNLNTTAPVDEILEADARRRALLVEVEQLKAELNATSKRIPKADPESRPALVAEMRALGDRIQELDAQVRETEAQLEQLMLLVPNMPDPSVPVGRDGSENVVVRTEGQPREPGFTPRPHWEIMVELGIIDFERGVKMSGTRFYVLLGDGARLQRALITYMLDLHTQHHGYREAYPPYLVKRECMVGTGNLPKFADNLYHDEQDDLWLIPTAEVPLTNFYREEMLEAADLPKRFVGYTACFRREQMAAGKDTRGIKRGHQFDKVELMKYATPETSLAELQGLIHDAEQVLVGLGLPYRVVQMCTGDLSFSAAIKFDLEAWAPGVNEWLEVSSCSLFNEFQARRANIRYRPEPGAKPRYLHTMNGSGLALPRTLIALIENYQQADGTVVIPEVLRPYLGGKERITQS
jgi:seryl-tRNA synthetase